MFALGILNLALSFVTAQQDGEPVTVPTRDGPVLVERLATLEFPWAIAVLPDGSCLITEKPGRLRLYANGQLSEPLSGIPPVVYKGQGGLLGLTIDPDFATNHKIYFSFTEAAAKQPAQAKDNWDPRLGSQTEQDNVLKGAAVASATLDGNGLKNVKVIWRQFPKTIGRGHYGAHLVFGADKKLYITSGERQRFSPAQDPKSNLGKVVRINADGSIPTDNPYTKKPGWRHDIWTMGHRNPLGAAVNPVTKQLWINEMGPRHGDEFNLLAPGKNYGWPMVSNGDNYNGVPIPDHPTRPEFEPPVYYWHPAISPSGLMFYTGSLFKNWQNNVFLGALSGECLIRLKLEGVKITDEERLALRKRVRDVTQTSDGAILVLTDYKVGELLRLTPGKQ